MPINFLPPDNGKFLIILLESTNIKNVDIGQKAVNIMIGSNFEVNSVWITLLS